MGSPTRAIVAAIGGLVGSAAAVAAIGRLRWDRSTTGAVRRLRSRVRSAHPERFSLEQLAGLPDPVARYFAFALTPGQPFLRSARVEQAGEFRIGGFEAP